MHHISHIVPDSGSVDLENLKICITAKSTDTFQPHYTYAITATNKSTLCQMQLMDVKYMNSRTLEAYFPKLREAGSYKFTICAYQLQSSKQIQPDYVKSLSSIVGANLAKITSSSDIEVVTKDEPANQEICCDVEFICYPIIQPNATNVISSSYEGGESITIYGAGFSPNAKIVIQDKEMDTEIITENQLSAIIPPYDIVKEGRIGVKSNNVIAFSNMMVKYRMPEIGQLSNNNVCICDNPTIMIHGDYFGKPENASKLGVYLNDIPCSNVNVINDKQISFTLPAALLCANVYNCTIGVNEYRSNERYIEISPFIEKLSESSLMINEIGANEIKIYGQGFDEQNEVFFGRIKCSHVKKEEDYLVVKVPEEIQRTGNYPVSVKVNDIWSNAVDFKIANHKIISVEEKDAMLYIHGNGLDGDLILYMGYQKIKLKNDVENVIVVENRIREVFGPVDIYVEKNSTESTKIKHNIAAELQNRSNLVISNGSTNEKLELKYPGKCSGNKICIAFDLPPKDEWSDPKYMKISKCENVFENGITTFAFCMPYVESPHSDIEVVLYIDNIRFDEFVFHYLPKIELVYQNVLQWNHSCVVKIVGDNIPSSGKITVDEIPHGFIIENEYNASVVIPPMSMGGQKSVLIVFDKYPSIHFPVSIFVLPEVSSIKFSKNNKMVIIGHGFCKNINYRATLRGEGVEMLCIDESTCEIITEHFSHDKQNHICLFADEHLFYEKTIQYPDILTSIVPNYGTCSHAREVILHGNGFSKQTKVVFGGKTRDDMEYISNAQIKFKIPECAQHDSHVIYTINGEDHASINTLCYTSIPELTRLSASSGSCLGKNEITIYGKGFANMENVKVLWDEKELEYDVVDNSSLLVLVPPKRENTAIKIALKTQQGFETNVLNYEYLPHLEKLSEYNGYMNGGKTIHIHGYGFSKNMKVLWDNIYIDSNIISESELSVVLPKSNHTKTIDVEVEYNNHKSKQILKYSYIPHTISNIYPNEGSVKGNYEVTIHGDGLFSDEDMYVVVGASMIPKSDLVFYDQNTIRFRMPESTSAGKNTVDVIINNGKADKSLNFEYISRITSLSQNSMQVNAKTPITIFGEGFNGSSIVNMGEHTIQNVMYDAKDGSIRFVTPIIERMQKLTISVNTNNRISNEVVMYVKPIIKNILPNPWIAEDSGFLYVSGEGFQENVVACIMGLKSPSIINPLKVTNTNVTFVLPYIKQCGEIIVAIGLLDIAENMWIAHKINVQPKIMRLSESSGPVIGNNKIEIIGKGFHPRCKIQICDSSTFFQTSRIEFVSENSIIVTMPPVENVTKIVFMLWCNEIPSNSVEYNYCPYIKDIKPNYASINGGVTVTIEGEGFDKDSVVFLNKMQIAKDETTFDSSSGNLKVIIPKHFEVENMALKVVSNGCESMNSAKFFYTPFLDSVSITNTSVTKQEIIKLYGNGFSKNTSVKIGDKMANKNNIFKIFDNFMEIKLPLMDEQSILDIRVITNGIPTAQTKSIAVAAELSYIQPLEGPVKGGTPIHIYGNGFTDEMTIFFNDVKIPYKKISNQQFTITSPTDNTVLGNNSIQLICNKFTTNLSAKFGCYPSISNMMQKYDSINKKMTLWIQGRGLSTSTQILVGKKTGLVVVCDKNSIKVEFDENLKYNGEAEEVFVITHDYKSRDKLYYSAIPTVTKISNDSGVIAGNNEITIQGYGFDKEYTYILWNKASKIKPHFISSNKLKFYTPAHFTSEKIIYNVVSNEMESAPMEFMYCPEIYSLSEKTCNIGEELSCKIYGEGFEYENSEIIVKNNGKCRIKEYINNKIIDVVCGPFKQCGIYEVYAETSGVISQTSAKIEVKPIIAKICNDIGNVNGDKIQIIGIGVNANTSILFCYKDYQAEFNHILLEKTGKKYNEIEQIVLCYDTITEFKNRLIHEKKDALHIQVKIKTNGIESMPLSWIMKNLEAKQNIDHEIIKAITMCNNYLSTNAFNQKYQCITPYSDKLVFKLSEMITSIYELPETICDVECRKILVDGFLSICDKNEQVSIEILQNMLIHMTHALINKLCFGTEYDAAIFQIRNPLLINVAENKVIKNGEYDYYFQEHIDVNESNWIINAQELSRAICFKILCDGSIEFKYNHMVLDTLCEQFEKKICKRNFLLVNTSGRFNGTTIMSPGGNIIELFSCKVTSALESRPHSYTSCIDMDSVAQDIVEGKQADGSYNSLAKQLKSLLLNREIITNMYNHYQKNTLRIMNSSSANEHEPFPFKRGDTLLLKIMIRKPLATKEVFAIRELSQYKIACDPDNENRNSAYDFLVNNDSTEIRATNDCYEIVLG